MRLPSAPLVLFLLAIQLALAPRPAAADDPATPRPASEEEPFEVIVVRGAGVARVSGTRSGVIHEQTLREDPRPARREPAPRPAPRAPEDVRGLVIVLNGAPAYTAGYPFWFGDPFFARHRYYVWPQGRHRRFSVSSQLNSHFYRGPSRHHGQRGRRGNARRF